MAKKKFRDWISEEYEEDNVKRYNRKDGKRYDKKKARIQNARKNKKNMKNSFFDG